MKIIYFHIDELARDAIVASALKKELKKRGVKLVYGNRFTTQFLSKFNVFDLAILPSLGHYTTTYPTDENLPDNIVILPSEAVGQATGTLRRMNAKYFGNDQEKSTPWHKKVKAFLLWGYSHVEPFERQYPEYLPRCTVVGHPRLDKHCLKSKESKSQNPRKKIKVGLVSRFSGINPYHGKTIYQIIYLGMRRKGIELPAYENSPDRDIEDQLYTEMIDLRLFFQIIEKIDAEKFEICMRPYPRENRFNWFELFKEFNLDVKISTWDEPFSFWLSEMDFIVSPPSTTFYDALSVGHLPICTMDIVNSRKDHVLTESDDNNQILEYVKRPKTIDELIELLSQEAPDEIHEDVKKILLGQTASDIAPQSIQNIADACIKVIDSSPPAKNKENTLALFRISSLILSYAQKLRSFFSKRGEQSANFALTLSRIRMINKLSG